MKRVKMLKQVIEIHSPPSFRSYRLPSRQFPLMFFVSSSLEFESKTNLQSIDKPEKCLYATRAKRVSSVDRVFSQESRL